MPLALRDRRRPKRTRTAATPARAPGPSVHARRRETHESDPLAALRPLCCPKTPSRADPDFPHRCWKHSVWLRLLLPLRPRLLQPLLVLLPSRWPLPTSRLLRQPTWGLQMCLRRFSIGKTVSMDFLLQLMISLSFSISCPRRRLQELQLAFMRTTTGVSSGVGPMAIVPTATTTSSTEGLVAW